MSTGRDRQLQAEVSVFDKVRFQGNQTVSNRQERNLVVPQLNMRGIDPTVKQSSNSERL